MFGNLDNRVELQFVDPLLEQLLALWLSGGEDEGELLLSQQLRRIGIQRLAGLMKLWSRSRPSQASRMLTDC